MSNVEVIEAFFPCIGKRTDLVLLKLNSTSLRVILNSQTNKDKFMDWLAKDLAPILQPPMATPEGDNDE